MDTPGDKRYFRNMIRGVAQADISLFVISASGKFSQQEVMEHLMILYVKGIRQIIVAVNKMDEVK